MEFPDDVYREICCIKTLYSTKEGFFKDFIRIMFEKIEPEWIDGAFKQQKSEVDKIRICCSEPKVWETIQDILKNISKVYRKKCDEASKTSRLEADLLCQKGDFKKAVMVYSQSIIRAPSKGEDKRSLALAYKGRANAFFGSRNYQNCLADLNAALKEGFPTPLKHQIFRQMGECYKELSEPNKAQISLQVALKLIDDQILNLETTVLEHKTKRDTNKDKMLADLLDKERKEIKRIMAHLSSAERGRKSENSEAQYSRGNLPEITSSLNVSYPNASDLVTIKQSVGAGRFAVAAGRIDAGATLVVEEPQAACLIPQMLSSHCLHCFTRLCAAVPCKVCSGVAFCGVECRDAATSTYHKYECEFMGLFLGSGMSVLSFLSLRMVTQESLGFFKQLKTKIDALKANKESESATVFSRKESEYLKVYNLLTHSRMRTGKDYFRRTLMAIFLVKCLRKTDYFGARSSENEEKPFSEDEILTASIVLRHLELLQFNAHEIYETRVVKPGQIQGAKAAYIAVGIYPTVALFNHECSPSVTRYFKGKRIVIKAIRPLEKNEILSENYGPHYAKRTLCERIRELTSRYWFRCQCKACVEDWPTIDKLAEDRFKIRCKTPNCEGVFAGPKGSTKGTDTETSAVCRRCLKKTNVAEAFSRKTQIETLFEKGLDYMDSQNCRRAVPLLVAYLDEIFELVSPPCRGMFLCQEALRTCYAQTGNVWVLGEEVSH